MTTTEALDVNDLTELAKGFKRRLDARNRSPLTTRSYIGTVRQFASTSRRTIYRPCSARRPIATKRRPS